MPASRIGRHHCLSTLDVDAMCSRYRNGSSIRSIAKDFDVTEPAVAYWLKIRGVYVKKNIKPSRPLSDDEKDEICRRYVAGENTVQLAKVYGVTQATVYSLLRRRSVKTRDAKESMRLLYPLREDAFVNAEADPVASWWVGFLMADGCVSVGAYKKGVTRYTISLGLAERDRSTVEAFRDFLGSSNMICEQVVKSKKSDSILRSVQFNAASEKLVTDLMRYGVVPRKSLTSQASPEMASSADFWRGCVDGDGWVSMRGDYPKIGLCGSKSLVRQFHDFCLQFKEHLNGPTPYQCGKIWYVSYDGSFAKRVVQALYYDECQAYLPRKMEVAKQLKQWERTRCDFSSVDVDRLECLREELGTWEAVAKKIGTDASTIGRVRRRCGIERELQDWSWVTKDVLQQLYDENKTTEGVAEALGASTHMVYYLRRQTGLASHIRDWSWLTKEVLLDLYAEHGSWVAVATYLAMSVSQLCKVRRRLRMFPD